jgi:hypothetical protein
MDVAWAHAALGELSRRGLLEERRRSAAVYGFAPATPALAQTVAALAQLYGERPVPVVTLIFSQPNPNLTGFAEAFRLRKD